MTQAIDWALAQNAEAGSPLQGRIETTKIGVSGHSCGGLQALTIATTDPRVTTTLMLGTGVWSLGPGGLPGAPDVTKQSLKSVNGTIAYINGELDIALPNAKEDFALLSHVPAMLAQLKGRRAFGHVLAAQWRGLRHRLAGLAGLAAEGRRARRLVRGRSLPPVHRQTMDDRTEELPLSGRRMSARRDLVKGKVRT
jgi:hypothetical protein